MEHNSFIEFKKERDLGAIINDTFKFIRENWKAYFGAIIKIAGPTILGGAILMVLSLSYFTGVIGDMQGLAGSDDPNSVFGLMGSVFGWMGLLFLIIIVVYVVVSLTSLYYIKSYINTNGNVDIVDVRNNTFKNIWKFIGLGILIIIMVFFGAIMCYVPGIYLWVVLSLATSIMVFENKNIGDTISHCFTLIKGEWWNTFGVVLLVGLLVGMLGYVFSIPALIYQIIKMGTMIGENDPTDTFNLLRDPVYVALNVLSYVGRFVLSSITLIASVFIYYDLNEQKNLTGTIEKIDSLGQ